MFDRLVTAMLFVFTRAVQAVGEAFLRLTGCDWFREAREAPVSSGCQEGDLFPCSRMESFFAGLAALPIMLSLVAGWWFSRWEIVLVAPAFIVVPLLIYRYSGRNLFIPFFGSLALFFSILMALLLRFGVIVVLFLLYLAVFLLGPLFLAFFLSTV